MFRFVENCNQQYENIMPCMKCKVSFLVLHLQGNAPYSPCVKLEPGVELHCTACFMHYSTCCKSSALSFEGMQVNKSTCSQCKIAHKTYFIFFNYTILLCIKVLKHPQPLPQCSVVYDNLIHCNQCR